LTLAGIVERSANDPNAATNNPTRGYALSPQYAYIVRSYGNKGWEEDIDELLVETGTLRERLSAMREIQTVAVSLPDGQSLEFSPGEHNDLQKAIIEEFLPRYGFESQVLYVGDTAKKLLLCDKKKLEELSFFELTHDELPDVLTYSSKKN
jgi:type II restriction enzyme